MSEPFPVVKQQCYDNSTRISQVTTHWCRNAIGLTAYYRYGYFIEYALTLLITRKVGWVDYPLKNQHLKGHSDRINDLVMDGDGRYLFSASDDRTILVWDLSLSKIIRKFESAHTGFINTLDFYDESSLLVSGSDDHKIIIWYTNTSDPLLYCCMEGHTGSVSSVKFNDNGKIIVSGSDDGSIRVWSVDKNQCINCIIDGYHTITSVLPITPDSILTANNNPDHGSIKVWNQSTGNLRTTVDIPGLNSSVINVSLNRDQTVIAVCLTSRVIFFKWPEMKIMVDKISKKWSNQVLFHPYESDILILVNSCDIELYSLSKREIIQKMDLDDMNDETRPQIKCLCVTPDGSRFIIGDTNGSIHMYPSIRI